MGQQAFSQKQVTQGEQTWMGYFNQTRFTRHSGMWLDLHLRLNDAFTKELVQTIVRGGYTYYFSDQARFTAGYAYVTNFNTGANSTVPEHRPWQQIQWFDKKGGFSLMQWIRLEERYRRKVSNKELTSGYNFNYRIRYNIAMNIPLKGRTMVPHIPFLIFNDEIHINAGHDIVYNYFDQNRFFAGVGYQFTASLNAHLGYMNVFQQQPGGNQFFNVHAIRFFVFHNLDLRAME